MNSLSQKLSWEVLKNRIVVFRGIEKFHLIPLFSKVYCLVEKTSIKNESEWEKSFMEFYHSGFL